MQDLVNSAMMIQKLIIALLCFLLCGCFGVKPTTTKSGKHLFETFYAGAEGTQYFIKPLLFSNQKPAEELAADITFRYKNEVRDSAIINFSIKSPVIYKTIDSMKIANNDFHAVTSKITLLFNEKPAEVFVSRFTAKLPLHQVKQLFDNDGWEITIYSKALSNQYRPSKGSQKAIETLKDKVFVVM